jgi:hypothetical protein
MNAVPVIRTSGASGDRCALGLPRDFEAANHRVDVAFDTNLGRHQHRDVAHDGLDLDVRRQLRFARA